MLTPTFIKGINAVSAHPHARHLALPASLKQSLGELAAKRGCGTFVDLLFSFRDEAIATGKLLDTTPGFEVRSANENGERKIVLHMDGRPMPAISISEAIDVAQAGSNM
jgi:hypothetical protein